MPKEGACEIIRESACLKEQMPLIKCECGAEILLVPDLELMDKSIENHVEEHVKKEADKKKIEATAERIRINLITQVLEKASQTK